MRYQWVFGHFVIAQILAILARADYIMDDKNTTIGYANGGWDNGTNNYLLNTTLLFNSTV